MYGNFIKMSRFRWIWSRLAAVGVTSRALPVGTVYCVPKRSFVVPCALGFSLFTWLGFDKKLSAEDELIQTIKHCVLFIQRTEYDKAERLLHLALRQAQQIQHHLGITYIYDVMANLALERKELDKSKKLFVAVSQRVMSDGATEDDLRIVHISAKLARISHLMADHSTAQLGYDWCLEKLNKAYSTDPSEGLKKLIAMTEDWYGRLFLDCGHSEQALKYMRQSLDHLKEISDIEQEHIVTQLNDIGIVYDKMGRIDECIAYIKEAIEVGTKLDMEEDLGAMYVNLGRAYLKKHMLDEARKKCGYGWRLGTSTKNDEVITEAESCLQEIKNMS